MRRKGITYDQVYPAGRSSRPGFEPGQVRRDMGVLARELRCDAVRVTGGDLDRLSIAAGHAAAAGLEVWFSPQPCELGTGQMLALFHDASRPGPPSSRQLARRGGACPWLRAERPCRRFLPGADSDAHLTNLLAPPPELLPSHPTIMARLNDFFARRRSQRPPVLCRAGHLRRRALGNVNWQPLDIVSVDAYRDAANADGYRPQIRLPRCDRGPADRCHGAAAGGGRQCLSAPQPETKQRQIHAPEPEQENLR